MFLRRTTVTSHGSRYEYVHLVESYRREQDGRPTHRIIANLGRLDETTFENLRTALEAARKNKRVAVVKRLSGMKTAPKPAVNLHYLDIAVARELWNNWGLDEVMQEVMGSGQAQLSSIKVLEALVTQRLVAAASKLAAVRWFPKTALPELQGVTKQEFNNTRVHRVMDELEAATPGLMAKLPGMYRERSGAFFAMYLDVSDVSFVGHGPEMAARGRTKSGRIRRKVGIVLMCNQDGYPLRWRVIRGNCTDGEAMLELLDGLCGVAWAQDAPIVMDRSMGRSAYLRKMLKWRTRFLTAMVRQEYSTYAPELPWQAMQELEFPAEVEVGKSKALLRPIIREAARRAVDAGMEQIEDTLFVKDFGVVEVNNADGWHSLGEENSSNDPVIRALHVVRYVRQAVADGRYDSQAAAARAFGLTKSLLTKYNGLLKLSEKLQEAVLEGEAEGWPLAVLLRIARIADKQKQHEKFESLLEASPASASSEPEVSRPLTSEEEESTQSPLKARVVSYFNPEYFVDARAKATGRVRRIERFAQTLNDKLARPQSNLGPEKIYALMHARLKRYDLITMFDVTVAKGPAGVSPSYQVSVELKQEEWDRARRYDGFSVLVTPPDISLPAARLCQMYRSKDMVEKDFQTIKGLVEIEPIRHHTDPKVSAHVTICMLALLLERTLRQRLQGKCSAQKALEILADCHLNKYSSDEGPALYTTTELDGEQRSLLRKLRLLHLADDDYVAGQISPR